MPKIIKRYPRSSTLGHLQEDINRLFEPFSWLTEGGASDTFISDWSPKIDIKDEDKHYLIRADIPGVDPKDIEVHLENGVLTIKGEKETKTEDKTEDYIRVERSTGTFLRRFTLPETVDAENIKAKSKHGVLEVIVPKSTKNSSRKISVEE